MNTETVSQREYERLLRYEETMKRCCEARGYPLPWEREGRKAPSEEVQKPSR